MNEKKDMHIECKFIPENLMCECAKHWTPEVEAKCEEAYNKYCAHCIYDYEVCMYGYEEI